MDRLWRSNSSVSSRSSCPPGIVNEEDHNVEEHEIPNFRKWTIPKIDTKNVYKISWAKNSFHSAYKVRNVEQIFSISKTHEKCCFLKRILVNSLLLKNSAICILEWFKLLLNHSPERVLMLLFSCVYVMLDLRTLKIAFLV